ncbi:MAG: class I SAM-dependent methyltransferase [Acidobacteria bacterium]|nr:class I SAM-dependent methyltransferase [Acidobacteriota bacterium]
MTRFEQEKWQARYATLPSGGLPDKPPAPWLRRWSRVVPRGRVVDLGMGLGGNALYLAARGASVLGIDISERAVRALRQTALNRGLRLELIVADLDVFPLPVNRFDAVLCFFYLNRHLFPKIRSSLKPGGVFLMEAFVTDPQRPEKDQPRYRLAEEELLTAFGDWDVLDYAEGAYPESPHSQAATARICAKKPLPKRPPDAIF